MATTPQERPEPAPESTTFTGEPLGALIVAMARAQSEPDALQAITEHLAAAMSIDRASVVWIAPSGGNVEALTLSGEGEVLPPEAAMPLLGSASGEAVRVRRMLTWSPSESSSCSHLRSLAKAGYHSTANAPIEVGGEVAGTLNVGSYRPDAFGDAELAALEQVAALLSSTVARVRLSERARTGAQEYTARLEALNEISRSLSTACGEQEALEAVARNIHRVAAADYVCLGLLDDDDSTVRVVPILGGADDIDLPESNEQPVPLSGTAQGEAIAGGEPTFFGNLAESPFPDHEPLAAAGLRAGVSIPAETNNGTFGVLTAAARDSEVFDDDTLNLLSALARILGATTERVRAHVQLEHQATHDPLTGLLNRRGFHEMLEQALLDSSADSIARSVLVIDIDHFKVVNDSYGHPAGDALLRDVVALVTEDLPRHDVMARLGGDEFAVLLNDCTAEDAVAVGERLRERVEAATFAHDGRTLGISISIGAAGIDGRIDDVASVMTAADMACYTAKNTGRNRVVAASGDSARHRRDDRDAEYVTLVRRALADDRLTIYGQPIAPTGDDDGRLRLEVLVRVINEDGSVLEPARFISAAERFGLVRRIDEWVLRATLDQLTAQPAALERMELCMLNLSAHSIQDADFLDTAMWLIQRSEVPSTSLAFEITESAAISRLGSAQRFIAALAELGVRFAIDDFGEGFSSFRHLKQLDVDFIKIDGGIIRNIADDPIDRAMARSVHQLGNAMGLETIAEFVEGDAIMSAVREIGIDFAQGYGIGQPEPLADLTARAAAAGQPNASAG